MEYETLIDTGRDGLHCILFANRDVLEKEEIEEIFSRYGDVANIKFHQDNKKGICFVRFHDRDDAIRAVDGLRGDSQITLLEHNKKKQKNGGNFERRQGSDRGGQENCDGTRFIQQFNRQHNQDNGRSGNGRNGDYKENSHYGNSNNNMPWGSRNTNGNQKQNDMPWGSNNANGNQQQSDQSWRSKSPNEYKKQNDMPCAQRSPNNYQKQKQNDIPWGSKSPNEFQKQNDVPCAQRSPNNYPNQNDAFRGPNSPHRYQESNTELPDLVDPNRRPMAQIENQSLEVPELVTANGRTLSASSPIKKQIIIAQEVIVANIHPQFGAPYILHLFDKYEPLAISNMMVEPKTGKRYCHVYFKSADESQQVETSFDKKLLMDQRLVVLRSNRLVESAYFK